MKQEYNSKQRSLRIKSILLLFTLWLLTVSFPSIAQQNIPVKIKMQASENVTLKSLKKKPLPVAVVMENVVDEQGRTIISKGAQVYAIYKEEKGKEPQERPTAHVIEFKYIKDKSGKTIPIKGFLIMRTAVTRNTTFVLLLVPPLTPIGLILFTIKFFSDLKVKKSLSYALFNYPVPIIVSTH
ncbi:MAG: hypothetical protein GXO48_09765 [Chlorobi bacterium]|nr:hypothetical protein [Chlorobiota bacterium]